MKTVVGLILYAIVSGVTGVVICSILTFFKLPRASHVAAWIFFGGPVCAWLYFEARDYWHHHQFKQDAAYVKELCAKHGEEKIFRTVENVEGVFQIKPRMPITDEMWRDRQGMPDPWGKAMGDSDKPAIAVGPGTAEEGRNGYWFVEQRIADSEGPPYGRRLSPSVFEPNLKVKNLRSRYGYLTEDLSTPEMRSRWIAGGRISVIDLKTGEVIATTTGYFRAVGPRYLLSWSGSRDVEHFCPIDDSLGAFLRRVLRPFETVPSEAQIKSLKEE
ncbi:MAG: hypothetical protein AB7P37_14800 [Ramlibacter sp.]